MGEILGPFKKVSGEHWLVAVCTVIALVVTCVGALTGAAIWVDSSFHSSTEASLAAINLQSAIIGRMQIDFEKRVTALEIEHDQTVQASAQLSTEIVALRTTVGDLSVGVQKLNDLLLYHKK